MANPETTTGVTVALAVRPHGVRGEIACDIYTDFPDRLKSLKSVQLWDGRRQMVHPDRVMNAEELDRLGRPHERRLVSLNDDPPGRARAP